MDVKLGDAKGSNAGGVYRGADGKLRYVKLYTDPSQAAGEHLANQIYADMGLGRIKSQVFDADGSLAYASELIDGVTPLGGHHLTPKLAKQALDGLVGDLVTGNWDAVGMSFDNMVVTKSGKLLRIDNGGTFLMRAQAGRKPKALLQQLTEWEAFFNPSINPTYSKLAQTAGITGPVDMLPAIRKQLKKLQKVASDAGGWDAYVDKVAPQLGATDRAAIVEMLEARTKLVAEKIAEAARAKKVARVAVRRPVYKFEDLELETIPDHVLYPGGKPGEFESDHGLRALQFSDESRKQLESVCTPGEIEAINYFTGGGYSPIRAALKLTKSEFEREHGHTYEENHKAGKLILSALKKSQAAQTRIETGVKELYRGLKYLNRKTFDELLNKATVTWDEPTSTSWRPRAAVDFYGGASTSYGILYRIKPAPRTSGVAVEGVSLYDTEAELIYGGGTTFRVTKVVRDSGRPKGAIVYLEELP
jgi:hypothetical protein